jgi:hypothetical protein
VGDCHRAFRLHPGRPHPCSSSSNQFSAKPCCRRRPRRSLAWHRAVHRAQQRQRQLKRDVWRWMRGQCMWAMWTMQPRQRICRTIFLDAARSTGSLFSQVRLQQARHTTSGGVGNCSVHVLAVGRLAGRSSPAVHTLHAALGSVLAAAGRAVQVNPPAHAGLAHPSLATTRRQGRQPQGLCLRGVHGAERGGECLPHDRLGAPRQADQGSRAHTHAHAHTRTHTHTRMHAHAHAHARPHTQVQVCMYPNRTFRAPSRRALLLPCWPLTSSQPTHALLQVAPKRTNVPGMKAFRGGRGRGRGGGRFVGMPFMPFMPPFMMGYGYGGGYAPRGRGRGRGGFYSPY